MSHDFDNHLDKQVSIQLDKAGKIISCDVKEQSGRSLKANDIASKSSQNKATVKELELQITKSLGDDFGH